jgi:hypothetical protein
VARAAEEGSPSSDATLLAPVDSDKADLVLLDTAPASGSSAARRTGLMAMACPLSAHLAAITDRLPEVHLPRLPEARPSRGSVGRTGEHRLRKHVLAVRLLRACSR